ncbi:hypothetical protein AYR62_01730 [Secundilactobacillus paracollinoides]|uniref:bifunctional glutamate--cysteine ligase GshA/glutathione synthetase GshB n=1 Tax=Secundilactobacillus paracollinoides TaxID=240427 RepID=UPI00081A9AFC|nr:bifunctional glutamate--cysteine ligase GshA/glutathione synthetase GshB [Secundilactobacillus paracollinoides]ANZ62947.1 hypothetical protein AYR62_01730 [Secundilactobacillus paracollinoides]
MNMQEMLRHTNVAGSFAQCKMGIEREGQRATLQGQLATTDHPQTLGSRAYHPYIQTDFAETQLELITPICTRTTDLTNWLELLHTTAETAMAPNEVLWPISMPPALPKDEQDIQLAKLSDPHDVAYRSHLAAVYGRRKQMVSGIHFNFEFDPALVKQLFDQQNDIPDFGDFKTALYFKVTRNYLRYQWLITYLMGASPTSEPGYFTDDDRPTKPVRSIRNSHYGYTNGPDVHVSYADMPHYLADLDRLEAAGTLSQDKEFYAPVRLRGGHEVHDLRTAGVEYLELRNIDLNPFSPYGINSAQITFLRCFLLTLLWLDEEQPADDWVATGTAANDAVALEDPTTISARVEEGEMLVNTMEEMSHALQLPLSATLFNDARYTLHRPEKTPAYMLYTQSRLSSQERFATGIAMRNKQSANTATDRFMATNVQLRILLINAVKRGITVTFTNRTKTAFKLSFNDRTIYVSDRGTSNDGDHWQPVTTENPLPVTVAHALDMSWRGEKHEDEE